jgi:hypothetical protein
MRELRYSIDKSTRALNVIDYPHHEVHAGSHFFFFDAISLNAEGSQYYLIEVPNTTKWAHLLMLLDGSAITQFRLYENTDKQGDEPQSIFNSNRNSLTAPELTIYKGVVGGSTDGVLLMNYKGGASSQQSRQSSGISHEEEIILRQGVNYILRVNSGTASNLINVHFTWYEHTNKADLLG